MNGLLSVPGYSIQMLRESVKLPLISLAILIPVLLISCGDQSQGLSRDDVRQIVREELAEAPAPPRPETGLNDADVEDAIRRAMAPMRLQEPGLSRTEVEEIMESAVAAIPEPDPGLTSEEVREAIRQAFENRSQSEGALSREQIEQLIGAAIAAIPEPQPGITSSDADRIARAAIASTPLKSSPAEYTRFFVQNAISRYESQGLAATLAHYNRPESVDGQWYTIIIDGNDLVIGHPDPERLGLDLKGWVGIDANGYNFGPEMLSATGEGKWVSYVYRNPQNVDSGDDHTGTVEYKHVWVVRHAGLLFASGWHISADEFTKFVVDDAIARYRTDGLEDTLAHYNDPDSVNAQWYVFIATPEGGILGHHNAEEFGVHLRHILEDGSFEATEEGTWVNHQDVNPATGELEEKHFWLVEHDGLVFGSGWHHDASGS